MSPHLSSFLAIGFLLLAPLCSAAQITLTIASAADLTSLEPPLESAFRKTTPGVALRFVNEASAVLAQQIENGAPYDVFLSANTQFVDRLTANRKLLGESIEVYALGRIGVLWRDNKPHNINDLAQPSVRVIALPNPKLAPYGVAAQQALEHAGIWSKVQPKIVYGENVREALEMFTSGNADAVLTSASLLRGKNPQLIPDYWHRPITQEAGIVPTTRYLAQARRFLAFLISPYGQAVFSEYGFAPPPKR